MTCTPLDLTANSQNSSYLNYHQYLIQLITFSSLKYFFIWFESDSIFFICLLFYWLFHFHLLCWFLHPPDCKSLESPNLSSQTSLFSLYIHSLGELAQLFGFKLPSNARDSILVSDNYNYTSIYLITDTRSFRIILNSFFSHIPHSNNQQNPASCIFQLNSKLTSLHHPGTIYILHHNYPSK